MLTLLAATWAAAPANTMLPVLLLYSCPSVLPIREKVSAEEWKFCGEKEQQKEGGVKHNGVTALDVAVWERGAWADQHPQW